MAREPVSGGDLREAMVETYAVNERINQMILESLDERAWQAKPAGKNTRTIAAIFSHMHNIRRKWLRLSAPYLKLPQELDRRNCTRREARKALAESGCLCGEMLAEGLKRVDGRVKKFLRDGWARPWQPGAAMFTYMVLHDAHHRGQICMLAHQMGYPLPKKVGYEMWMWEKLWKKCGFTGPR